MSRAIDDTMTDANDHLIETEEAPKAVLSGPTSMSFARVGERGANLVEYALLLGLIAIVCVVAVTALGSTTAVPYSEVGSTLGS